MSIVTGIGSSLFDMLSYCDSFPQEDTKMESRKTVLQGGGPCSTALVAVEKLGVQSGYIGMVGDDAFGDFIQKDFQKYHVDLTGLKVSPGKRSFHSMVICNTGNASRTCIWNRGDVPDPEVSQFDLPSLLHETKILHLDGYYAHFALQAAKIVHEAGGLVSLDAGTIRPDIEQVMAVSDVLIPSREFALKVTGEKRVEDAIVALAKRYHPSHLVVTCGSEGGMFFQEGKVVSYPAFKVDAIDSNGAGDVFHGAFLVGLLHGWTDRQCCVFASAVSAMKCRICGAREGVPSFSLAMEFLLEKGLMSSVEKGLVWND